MNQSLAQSLGGLVPTLSGPLPSELLELAISILAQSRSKASSLKAEEEIARSYACAHLACERLKQTLGLPKIQPRPPCPPRIYQKLYRYLDAVLPKGSRRRGRPPKSDKQDVPLTSTPAKFGVPPKSKSTKPVTPRRKGLQHVGVVAEVPEWVMPITRRLCSAMGAPAAPPHVFAGVSSILTLPPPIYVEPGDSSSILPKRDKIPALIITVYFFVALRLLGKEIEPDEYNRQRDLAVQTMNGIDIPGLEREDIQGKDVDVWLVEIRDKGWFGLDWYANIGEGTGLTNDTGLEGNEYSDNELEVAQGSIPISRTHLKRTDKNTLYAGLGTMMQDKVDYLSQERRADYLTWKACIMARIDILENQYSANTTTA